MSVSIISLVTPSVLVKQRRAILVMRNRNFIVFTAHTSHNSI